MIQVDFSSASDKCPLVTLAGRLVTAKEIHYTTENGLTIVDDKDRRVVGALPEEERTLTVAEQIQRYFEHVDEPATPRPNVGTQIARYLDTERDDD